MDFQLYSYCINVCREYSYRKFYKSKLKNTRMIRILNPIIFRCPNSVRNRELITSVRKFSSGDESHDDFKPQQRKIISNGMDDTMKLIDNQVKQNPVMLYMKGVPSKPMCGFSLQAVRILNASGVEFQAVNVLEYPAIREAIKEYSDWPTIPQLYVKGEFVGGCDILTSMFKDGELDKLFKEHKLIE